MVSTGAILGIWITLFVLVLIVGLVIFIRSRVKRYIDIEIPEDPNLVMNFMAHLTGGSFAGIEIPSVITGRGGRQLITMLPYDIDKNLIRKPIQIVVGRGKRVLLPMGTQSQFRNVVWLFPERPQELDHYMAGMQKDIVSQNIKTDILNYIESGEKARNDAISRFGLGEFTKMSLDLVEDIAKRTKQDEEKK